MDDYPHGMTGAELSPLPSDVRNWGMLCHLVALLAMPLAVGHIVGPLIVWLMKRETHPFIDACGKESLNFQISMSLYSLLVTPLVCVFVGIPVLIGLFILNIVFVIIAAVKSSSGEMYWYPLTLRLIK